MKLIRGILFLYYLLYLIPLLNGELINNPIFNDQVTLPDSYPIIYKSEKAEFTSDSGAKSLDIKTNFVKFPHESYLISQPLFVFINENNKNNLFLGDSYFMFDFNSENDIKGNTIMNEEDLPSDVLNIKFKDYIMTTFYRGIIYNINKISSVQSNEIIFYGKDGENVYFYYKLEQKGFSIPFGNIDEQISCKVLKNAIYVCAFSESGQIKLKLLVFIYTEDGNKNSNILKDMYNHNVVEFNGDYDSATLYNTSDSNYKILCGRKIDNDNIECRAIEFNVEYSYSSVSLSTNEINVYELTNNYEKDFLYNEDYCNSIKYNSEFLVCCKKTDGIICDRRDLKNFLLITTFNLNLQGTITKFSFESGDDNLKILYTDEESLEEGVYEYYIYPPKCNNITLSINAYQTLRINFQDLFQIKTNTKYYVEFISSYTYFINTAINDVLSNSGKTLLNNDENYLDIIYVQISGKTRSIHYNVSLEETYSDYCYIQFIFKSCYSSCHSCSKSKEEADDENHFCEGCKENFYPFVGKETNCYSIENVTNNNLNWYLDNSNSMFYPCNSACKTCYGPTDENCLTCPLDADNNPLKIYNGKC